MIKTILHRHKAIGRRNIDALDLPRFDRYAVSNLRGGTGKTSLVFNLSFIADDLLAVDTCPQGSLSFLFDNEYFVNSTATVRDLILPNMIPALDKPARIARNVKITNKFFESKNVYHIPASSDLFMLSSVMATALNQARFVSGEFQDRAIDAVLYSLRNEIDEEADALGVRRCLIDTSPFFSGATHLAWHAADALIVPVRTDQQSVNALGMILDTLSNPSSHFRRILPTDSHMPKIQMVVLTHCDSGPETEYYVRKVGEIARQNITHFTTDDADNHILLLDDFCGGGQISAGCSQPIHLLREGRSMCIDGAKRTANRSADKLKRQLGYLSESIWQPAPRPQHGPARPQPG